MTDALLIGLDPGSTAIKAVEIERGENGHRLVSLKRTPVDPSPSRSDSLYGGLLSSGFLGHGRVATYPAAVEPQIEYLNLPVLKDRELDLLVRHEVSSEHDIPLNELILQYLQVGPVLPGDRIREAHQRVVVAFLRRVEVELTLQACSSAGLTLVALDTKEMALAECLLSNYTFEENEPAVILELGSSSSCLVAAVNGEVRFSRRLKICGNDLKNLLRENFGDSDHNLDELVKVCRIVLPGSEGENDRNMLSMVADGFVESLVGELNLAIDFGLLNLSDDSRVGDLRRLYLSGGISQLPGLTQYIANNLKVEVELLDPLRKIDFDFSILEALGVEQVPDMGVAMGLALRKVAGS